ncbi:hypothetical protein L9F63_001265, partial [Diploptera punctata]
LFTSESRQTQSHHLDLDDDHEFEFRLSRPLRRASSVASTSRCCFLVGASAAEGETSDTVTLPQSFPPLPHNRRLQCYVRLTN